MNAQELKTWLAKCIETEEKTAVGYFRQEELDNEFHHQSTVHYQRAVAFKAVLRKLGGTMNTHELKFHALLAKSNTSRLNESEENELLKLNSFLESTLAGHTALTEAKKHELASGRIEELLESTQAILASLRRDNDTLL